MEGEWDVNVLNCCYDVTVCLIALVPVGTAGCQATATTEDSLLWFACALCCLCLGELLSLLLEEVWVGGLRSE